MTILILLAEGFFFFFKQKTAYEMRISDWSSDVCSSDLRGGRATRRGGAREPAARADQRAWRRVHRRRADAEPRRGDADRRDRADQGDQRRLSARPRFHLPRRERGCRGGVSRVDQAI